MNLQPITDALRELTLLHGQHCCLTPGHCPAATAIRELEVWIVEQEGFTAEVPPLPGGNVARPERKP